MPASARPRRSVVDALLARHGRTFAQELGIRVERNTPSPLYRLLCAATLMSARIGHRTAVRAAQALAEEGWTTAPAMAEASWEARARTLARAGYARFDERTATMLGDAAQHLLDRYGGDLRRLREEAGRDPAAERALLRECKGVGDVGVDIFFREVQAVWEELRPFADERALAAARRLRLGGDPAGLARLVPPRDLPRLVAALVRTDLEDDGAEVLALAG